MRKFLFPATLVSAAAIVVACTTEGPTSPKNMKQPAMSIGVASAGEAQVCLSASSPNTLTYSAALAYSGDVSGDIQATSPQALTPGGCFTALLDQQPGLLVSPIGWVTS